MSDNLKKCLEDLKVAMNYKDKTTRNAILKFLSNKKCIYEALREISTNILNKKIKLNGGQIQKLGPHVKTIKALKKGGHRKRFRKRLVQQTGGFLPWLIPIVASAIPAVLDLIK